jgi:hypothetical protein
MLEFPGWSGKVTARAGRRIWGASAGLDDDGTRSICLFLHKLGIVEDEDEEQVAGQEPQHCEENDGKTKHKQTDNRFLTGE